MIIGNGNIAKSIIDREDVIFFASGCSDSSCTDEKQFEREFLLLTSQPEDKHLIYFSNLGIYRWTNRYIEHKKQMEQVIKDKFQSYTIVRMEICDWVTNPTTILNVFRRKIAAGELIDIQDTCRSVITLKEFQYWLQFIPVGEKNEMNITGRLLHVRQIYKMVQMGDL